MTEPCMKWDVVKIKGYDRPMIYINPNEQLKNKKEGDIIDIEISNTDSVYDNKNLSGILVKNCNIPSYRPNYSEKTGYYTIVLNTSWVTYPKQLGEVTFSQKEVTPEIVTPEIVTPEIDINEEYTIEPLSKKNDTPVQKKCTICSGMGILQIVLISIVIITLIFLIIFSSKK